MVAAGGFRMARPGGALAWGADGIAMGTRFLMTAESPVPRATLQRYLDCSNPGEIIVSRAMDGLPQRMIMNELLAELERGRYPAQTVDCPAQRPGVSPAYRRVAWQSVALCHRHEPGRRDDHSQAIVGQCPMIIQKAMVAGEPALGVLPSGQVAG